MVIETFEVETLVIGAGVVGLAVARALAIEGQEAWLLEQEAEFGMQTSSRNSEVIHAGIYYPKGSLKARLCVEGKQKLYRYCDEKNIPVSRLGKLIVASTEEQVGTLESIRQRALNNGVDDLRFVDSDELRELEPELNAQAALLSPSTGIIDSHAYMQQLLTDFESYGGQIIYQSQLKAMSVESNRIQLDIVGQDSRIIANKCINAAGLQAPHIFRHVDGFPQTALPKAFYAKGDYFSYSGKAPFKHLIYPVPEVGGLGIHLTLDQAGQAKFGPDVEWLDDELYYEVKPDKKAKFLTAVRKYWPNIDESRLVPDYSGIRPKLSGPDEAAADFVIQGEGEHGIKGLVNLFGIESPGLTASLAIADEVVKSLES